MENKIITLAEDIFDKHYTSQFRKSLQPHKEALRVSIKEAEEKGLLKVKKYLIENF
tara:strand:- start:839 stop:1006 length:168 start_codon:yes stop_codon:yes gene_type:complete